VGPVPLDSIGETHGELLAHRRQAAGEARSRVRRFDRCYLAQRPLVVVRDHVGRLAAFVNEVPGVRPAVATVDLMRHRRAAPNGLMDYLFSELMLLLREEGYRWFSLGLAPLAGVGGRPGARLRERAVHQAYEHFEGALSLQGSPALQGQVRAGVGGALPRLPGRPGRLPADRARPRPDHVAVTPGGAGLHERAGHPRG
jgi:hypothetical protein